MAHFPLKRRWTKKPPESVAKVDNSDIAAKDLACVILPENGAPKDLITVQNLVSGGAAECSGGKLIFNSDDGTERWIVEDHPKLDISYFSIAVEFYLPTLKGQRLLSRGSDGGTLSRYDIYLNTSGVRFNFRDSGDVVRDISLSNVLVQGLNRFVLTYDGSRVFIVNNGKEFTASAAFGAIKSTDGNPLNIGVYLNETTHPFEGNIHYMYISGKALSDTAARSWQKAPHKIFQPKIQLIDITAEEIAASFQAAWARQLSSIIGAR